MTTRPPFLRPEAVKPILRWSETALWAGVTLFALWRVWDGFATPLWRWPFTLAVGAVGFWLTRAAALSALAAQRRAAPGVVLIDERRITYLGPDDGGVASINEIRRIEIGAGAWTLTDAEGALVIPTGAEGAGGLPDAFSALPGFSPGRALAALSGALAGQGGPVTIWRRDEARPTITLAQPRRDA